MFIIEVRENITQEDKKMKNKIISVSCMHGRNETVSECINKMPFLEKVYVASTDEDIEFLKKHNIKYYSQHQNNPLSFKWNAAIKMLEKIDFDAVIILGSDDYVDMPFMNFIDKHIPKYDMIGFVDIYFRSIEKQMFYWPGYKTKRIGEPVGAGRVYTKKFLEKINYNLYPSSKNRGLDRMAWTVANNNNVNAFVTTLKENNLIVCDIKDGKGMNKLNAFKGLVKV